MDKSTTLGQNHRSMSLAKIYLFDASIGAFKLHLLDNQIDLFFPYTFALI